MSTDSQTYPKLSLVLYPHPCLRQIAATVQEINDEVRDIASQMQNLMIVHEGIGLAANQVGLPIRLIVATIKNKPQVMVNPEILSGFSPIAGSEGCLSHPGITRNVSRNRFIKVQYSDLAGRRWIKNFMDLEARIVQHEVDHLNAVNIIDH